MRRGQGRTRWSRRQSFSRMRLRQKAGVGAARGGQGARRGGRGWGWGWGWQGPASHSPGSSLRVTVTPEAEVGTMEASVPSRAAAGDNWVSLSPSNRATSLRGRERERERERESRSRPRPRQGTPRSLAQLPCLPRTCCRPYSSLTPPSSQSWCSPRCLGPRAAQCFVLSLASGGTKPSHAHL